MLFACWTAFSLACEIASGNDGAGTCVLPVAKPPYLAQAWPAAGVARNVSNAWMGAVVRKVTMESPATSTAGFEPLMLGNANTW